MDVDKQGGEREVVESIGNKEEDKVVVLEVESSCWQVDKWSSVR